MSLFEPRGMNIFAIGDIHGCIEELKEMLEKIDAAIKPGDIVVFIGDYIDRGPDAKAVIDLLIDRQRNHPNEHIFIRGNHEDMMFTGHYWLENGGVEVIKSYGYDPLDRGIAYHFYDELLARDFPDHYDFFSNTQFMFDIGGLVFVHAAIDPGYALDDQRVHDLIWSRDWDGYKGEYVGGYMVIRGHTPVTNVVERPNQIMIDTGCVFGNKLTCVVIDPATRERYYLTVKSKQPAW